MIRYNDKWMSNKPLVDRRLSEDLWIATCMNEWIDVHFMCMDESMYCCLDESMNGLLDESINEWLAGRKNEWMAGWMKAWMDGWLSENING